MPFIQHIDRKQDQPWATEAGRWEMRRTGIVDDLSFSPLYVEAVMLGRGEHARESTHPATGFLVGPLDDLVLVTAKHVLAGEDLHGKPLDTNGARPDVLRVHLHDSDLGVRGRKTVEVRLWADESWSEPLFASHPAGSAVDVAAVRLGFVPGHETIFPLDPTLHFFESNLFENGGQFPAGFVDSEIPLRVMDRVTILGFPFGDQGTWPTGVWTTGFVASEPLVPYDDQPAFLVDARTRRGLSGAPVLRYVRPADQVVTMAGDVLHHESHVVELLGVYSGRLNAESDLGRCVSVDAIEDVLTHLFTTTSPGQDGGGPQP